MDSISSAESADSHVAEEYLLGILDWLDMVVKDSDMMEQEEEEVRKFIEAELAALESLSTIETKDRQK